MTGVEIFLLMNSWRNRKSDSGLCDQQSGPLSLDLLIISLSYSALRARAGQQVTDLTSTCPQRDERPSSRFRDDMWSVSRVPLPLKIDYYFQLLISTLSSCFSLGEATGFHLGSTSLVFEFFFGVFATVRQTQKMREIAVFRHILAYAILRVCHFRLVKILAIIT